MGIEELCPSCRRLQVCLDCVEPALSVNKIGMRLLASLHLHLTRPVLFEWAMCWNAHWAEPRRVEIKETKKKCIV